MLLSYNELVHFCQCHRLSDVKPEHINATSIDVCLGSSFLVEKQYRAGEIHRVDLAKRESVVYRQVDLSEGHSLNLAPGDFVLAHTSNKFFMPDDISGEFSLKSSIARNGLAHLLAGWIDAGFNDSVLTLELHNVSRYHTLQLTPGMPIGQVKLFRHDPVPKEAGYAKRGRYNGDHSVQSIKE